MDPKSSSYTSPLTVLVLHSGGVRALHVSLQSLVADGVPAASVVVVGRRAGRKVRDLCTRYGVMLLKPIEVMLRLREDALEEPISLLRSGDVWMRGRKRILLNWYEQEGTEALVHAYYPAVPTDRRFTLALKATTCLAGERVPVSCLTLRSGKAIVPWLSNGALRDGCIPCPGLTVDTSREPLSAITEESPGQRLLRLTGLRDEARRPVGRPLVDFFGKHRGRRAFVIGNGPSLNKSNLEWLQGELTFCSNGFFAMFERISWRPSYYACIDTVVLPSLLPDLESEARELTDCHFFFPLLLEDDDLFATYWWMPARFRPLPNVSFFEQREGGAKGYSDFKQTLVRPATVTLTLLQLAVLMGCSPIYLIGCDHSYSIPQNATETKAARKGGVARLSLDSDTDPNHFDRTYFGKGKPWHQPNTDKMTRDYEQFKSCIDPEGLRIFNATVGGKLEVFPRVNLESLFQG